MEVVQLATPISMASSEAGGHVSVLVSGGCQIFCRGSNFVQIKK